MASSSNKAIVPFAHHPRPFFSAVWMCLALMCVLLVCSVVVTVTLATRVATLIEPVYCVAVAASSADVLALAASIVLVVLSQQRVSRRLQLVFWVTSAMITTSATSLTLYFLIWTLDDVSSVTGNDPLDWRLVLTGLMICALACVVQIVLHVAVLFIEQSERPILPVNYTHGAAPPAKPTKRSIGTRAPTPLLLSPAQVSSRTEIEPLSSAFSAYSDSVKPSFRSSMIRAISPAVWRARLVSSSSLLAQDTHSISSTKENSMEVARRKEDPGTHLFTSTPPATPVRTIGFHKRHGPGELESIPGSRPASPRNILYRSFPEHMTGTVIGSARSSHASESSADAFSFLEQSTRNGNKLGQSHIHPLFRSESAIPPPMASPGTVITASPFAGQIIGPEHQMFGARDAHFGPYRSLARSGSASHSRRRQESVRNQAGRNITACSSEPILPGVRIGGTTSNPIGGAGEL